MKSSLKKPQEGFRAKQLIDLPNLLMAAKRVFILLLLVLPATVGFSEQSLSQTGSPPPTCFVVVTKTSTSVTVTWSPVSGAVGYTLKYVTANGSESPEYFTANTTFTFSGLSGGSYTFLVASNNGQQQSAFIITEDVVNG